LQVGITGCISFELANVFAILEQTKEQYNLATQEAKTNSENHCDLENKYNKTIEQMKLLQNSCANA